MSARDYKCQITLTVSILTTALACFCDALSCCILFVSSLSTYIVKMSAHDYECRTTFTVSILTTALPCFYDAVSCL